MPNIDGPSKAKRRLVASVVHSKLLYAARVWASAHVNLAIHKWLSMRAVLVLASVPSIDLLTKEKQQAFLLRKQHMVRSAIT